ncbi:hypothetical protein AGLY_009370 [Aphis glycines]|uniref:Uncharacterized protein n=1 Tax=Aphis glycines TaxID=307491 RepID=A0A6G0THF0_APHGL|nr:hypothetical protein AGLY_009370 [Aphis glycines]
MLFLWVLFIAYLQRTPFEICNFYFTNDWFEIKITIIYHLYLKSLKFLKIFFFTSLQTTLNEWSNCTNVLQRNILYHSTLHIKTFCFIKILTNHLSNTCDGLRIILIFYASILCPIIEVDFMHIHGCMPRVVKNLTKILIVYFYEKKFEIIQINFIITPFRQEFCNIRTTIRVYSPTTWYIKCIPFFDEYKNVAKRTWLISKFIKKSIPKFPSEKHFTNNALECVPKYGSWFLQYTNDQIHEFVFRNLVHVPNLSIKTKINYFCCKKLILPLCVLS